MKRGEQEMLELFVDFARRDERIRLAVLEGSRTNASVPRDHFQDYDISYFVTDMDSYQRDDRWLDVFGERAMLQKPEAMELFPPELGNGFSYLMLFEDGVKADVTLYPAGDAAAYFAESDGLVEVLLDKDGLAPADVAAGDRKYWIRRPTVREFDDCSNEFWFVSTYVAKGLARKELLYAVDHLHLHTRPNVLRMLSWQAGAERGYSFSVGKNYKYLDRYVPEDVWETLLSTYRTHDIPALWRALFICFDLFRASSAEVARRLGYQVPDYDAAVRRYIVRTFQPPLG